MVVLSDDTSVLFCLIIIFSELADNVSSFSDQTLLVDWLVDAAASSSAAVERGKIIIILFRQNSGIFQGLNHHKTSGYLGIFGQSVSSISL